MMEQEILKLAARMERLENDRRRLFVATLLLILLCIAGWATTQQVPDKVSAKRFELIDSKGKVAGDFATRDNTTWLRIYDEDGTVLYQIYRNKDQASCQVGPEQSNVAISAGKMLQPNLFLQERSKRRIVWLSDRFLSMSLEDRIGVNLSTENSPQLVLSEADSRTSAGLGVSANGARMSLETGRNSEVVIMAAPELSSLSLTAGGGVQPTAQIWSQPKFGGWLKFSDSDGKTTALFGKSE